MVRNVCRTHCLLQPEPAETRAWLQGGSAPFQRGCCPDDHVTGSPIPGEDTPCSSVCPEGTHMSSIVMASTAGRRRMAPECGLRIQVQAGESVPRAQLPLLVGTRVTPRPRGGGWQLRAHGGGVWEAWAESRGMQGMLGESASDFLPETPPSPPSGLSQALWPPGGAP